MLYTRISEKKLMKRGYDVNEAILWVLLTK